MGVIYQPRGAAARWVSKGFREQPSRRAGRGEVRRRVRQLSGSVTSVEARVAAWRGDGDRSG